MHLNQVIIVFDYLSCELDFRNHLRIDKNYRLYPGIIGTAF
jgi:hypothetical protein